MTLQVVQSALSLTHLIESRRGVTFAVLGSPAPKGSVRPVIRGGRAFLTPSSGRTGQHNLRGWNTAVREAAIEAVGEVAAPPFVQQPLSVTLTFRLVRPGGHWATGKNAGRLKPSAPPFPAGKPDADKLARSTLDCMTGIVFDDDSRIVRLVVEKIYATPGDEGATITVELA